MYIQMKKQSKEVSLNIRITSELREKYRNHCMKNDIALSERVRQLIKLDLKGEMSR